MHALVLLCINQHMKFQVPSFTNSKDMIGAKFLKTGHVTLTTTIRGQSVIQRLALDIFHMHTKFGNSHFSLFKEMIAGV